MPFRLQLVVGGSGFQPRFTRVIAVKNRSHNPKTTDKNYKVSFSIKLAISSGQRLRLYETSYGIVLGGNRKQAAVGQVAPQALPDKLFKFLRPYCQENIHKSLISHQEYIDFISNSNRPGTLSAPQDSLHFFDCLGIISVQKSLRFLISPMTTIAYPGSLILDKSDCHPLYFGNSLRSRLITPQSLQA